MRGRLGQRRASGVGVRRGVAGVGVGVGSVGMALGVESRVRRWLFGGFFTLSWKVTFTLKKKKDTTNQVYYTKL